MAFDINAFVKKRKAATAAKTGGFDVTSFLKSRGITPKRDLNSSEGLYLTAQDAGGAVAKNAEKIKNPQKTFVGTLKQGLVKTLDILQRPNYAVASAVKNVIDKDTKTTAAQGLWTGLSGQTRNTFSDVFTEAGINPQSKAGKVAKGVAGFALDVLLDPTTYITFGAGSGVKVGAETLSKAGGKALAEQLAKGVGIQVAKDSIVEMAKKSPELYGHFLDKGGLKFFGQTIVDGGRIAGYAKAIPGMSKLDEATAPARNALYALFNRDASVKFGKLPQDWVDFAQQFRDLGQVKTAQALDDVINIAQANKLTAPEAEFIMSSIEAGKQIADDRLEHASQLFQKVFEGYRTAENKAGIKTKELKNYVTHILVEKPVKNIPWKPSGVGAKLPNVKARQYQKFVAETGEEVVGKAGDLGLEAISPIQGLSHQLSFGEFRSVKEIQDTLEKYGYKLTFKDQQFVHSKGTTGYFNPATKELVVASKASLDDVLSTVKHEMTHSAHFQLGGDIEMMELFSGRGGSQEVKKLLSAAKTSAKKEASQIVKTHGVDLTKVTPDYKKYVRKPTELLARAMQTALKDPALAAKEFPETAAAIKLVQAKHPLWKLLDKKVTPAGDIIGNRIFKDKAGKLFSSSGQSATAAEIKEALGFDLFDPNVVNAAAVRGVASARATTMAEFMRGAAERFGTDAAHAPSNYVESTVKGLEGHYFHPAIAESIEKFSKAVISDEATNAALKNFDKVQNLWKASVTSLFPAFHGRNAISNVFLNFLDIGSASFNPYKHALASHLQLLDGQASKLEKASLAIGEAAQGAKSELTALLDKPILTDAGGKTWTFGELRKVIKENRVAFSGDFTGFLDIQETVAQKLSHSGAVGSKAKRAAQAINPLSQENLAFKAGRKVGNKIEEQARILNFLTNLQKTGDPAHAAKRTKQFLFDYQNLSDFERTFLRRLIPFYTFTRKNLELQVGQFLKQPGKFATQAKLITTASKTISGSTLTADEQDKIPQFLKEGLQIVTKRDGANLQIISSFGLPIEQVFNNVKPNAVLGQLSPVIAVPLQVAIGKHFFFDKDLKDVNDATAYKDAPQFLKDYIGFTIRKNKDGSNRYVALNPTRLFIINNIPPSSRVIQSVQQLEAENVSGKLKVLRQLTGLKPYGVDMDEQEASIEKQKMRDLQDLLDKSGVAPIFQRSFVPKKTYTIKKK